MPNWNPDRNSEYDEWLDECANTYKIGYLEFSASDILYNCDPIAYNQGVLDYEDAFAE